MHNRQGAYKVTDNFLIPSFTGQFPITKSEKID